MLHVLQDKTKITTFANSECTKNEALFLLINAYVNHLYKALIKQDGIYDKEDQTLLLLQSQHANLMAQDKNHYHQAFTGMKMQASETVTHFLQHFMIAQSQ